MPHLFGVLTVFTGLLAAAPAGADDAALFKLLEIDGHAVKWGAPELGRGAVVTWRIGFARGTSPGRENCRGTVGVDGLLAGSHLGREDIVRAAATAFAMWSKAANIRFVPAGNGKPADITIAAEATPEGVAYTDVAPAAARGGRATLLSRAIVCLNPKASWTMASSGTYRLAYVLAHEIGHTIGLDHPGPDGTLMSFEYDAKRDALAPGDIAAAVLLYGTATRLVTTR